jgi:hypothetical protein
MSIMRRWTHWLRPVAFLAAFALLLVAAASAPAGALPIYAAREKMACTNCHVDPSGGGLRTAFGFEYLRNRHSMTAESRWADLPEDQPELAPKLPVGGDLRLLYDALHQRTKEGFPSELSTFFRMQGAFYLSYAPIERLRAYYNQDVNGVRDLWAMVNGALPGKGYVRIGTFRPPYGLRLEDHTIYQRDDLPRAVSVLGYDPRTPDAGIELGWIRTNAFAQASLTNGAGPSFDSDRNKAFTARAGRFHGPLLTGVTVRLDSQGAAAVTERRRFGAYGTLTPHPNVVVLGAIDLGEDEAGGAMTRSLLGWGEADCFFSRDARLRLRYEFLDLDRDQEFADSERYTVEGDWMPMPFATLRLSFRFTSNEQTSDLEELVGLWHLYF